MITIPPVHLKQLNEQHAVLFADPTARQAIRDNDLDALVARLKEFSESNDRTFAYHANQMLEVIAFRASCLVGPS